MEPNSKKIHFTFKDGDKKIKVKIPRPDKIIPANGRVVFTAAETKQNYDFLVDLKTDYRRSGQMSTTESCSFTTYEDRCRRVCDEPREGDRRSRRRNCRRVCDRISVTHHGHRDITYHNTYTDRDFILELQKPGSDAVSAKFNGNHTETSRVTDFRSACFVRGHGRYGRRHGGYRIH